MNDLCTRIVATLAHFLWQGTLIALLAAVAAIPLRRASSSLRYRVYVAALLLMGACPVVTFLTLRPVASIKANPAAVITQPAPARLPVRVALAPVDPPTRAYPMPVSAVAAQPAPFDWNHYAPHAVAVYALGVVLMLIRLLFAVHGGMRLRRSATPIEDLALLATLRRIADQLEMRVIPPIATCAQVMVPCVVGIIRPMILFSPALLSGLTPQQIEAILTHELAHLRCHDHLINLLQRVIESLLFFHPAVWLISRRIRAERENRCDDMVLGCGASAANYAGSLLRIAELCCATRSGELALGVTGRGSSLRNRVVRLIRGRDDVQVRVSRVWVLVVAMLIGIGSSATWYHRSAARADELKPETFVGILHDSGGRPVSNACIARDYDNIWYGVRSDVSGRFELKDIKPDQRHYIAFSQRSGRMGIIIIPKDLPKDPQPITLDLVEAQVDGRVVDASGNPVSGAFARVYLTTPQGEVFRFNTWAKTDNTGYFATTIPSGAGLKLHATLTDDPNHANRSETITIAGQPSIELPDLVVHTTTAPSPKPGPARVRYSGRVVDEANNPIPGVLISMSYPKNKMIASGGQAVTDADGRFSRLLPPDAERVSFRLLHPEFISFHFTRDEVTPAVSALRDGSAVIVMKRGLPISGVVTDNTGHPIFNALVLGGRLYGSTGGDHETMEDCTSARTDADGKFRIGGLPPGPHRFNISADGFAPAIATADISEKRDALKVTLETGVDYSGQVIGPEGKPLTDGYVSCDNWSIDGERENVARFTKLDSEGRFTLHDLPRTGQLELYAGGKGFMGATFNWSANAAQQDRITLYPPPVVTGIVQDAETAQPIPEFDVEPGWYYSGETRFAHSSFDGTKHVKSADGKFSRKIERIIVGADGVGPAFAARIVAKGYAPQVTPKVYLGKAYEPFVIKLAKASPITGTVVSGPDNKPVSGAQVVLVEADDQAWVQGLAIDDDLSAAPHTRKKTDAKGGFELPAPEGQAQVLVLHESGYAIVPTASLKPGDAIALSPWARVEGTVRSDGQPVNGASLAMSPTVPAAAPQRDSISFQLNTVTRSDGAFRFDYVPQMPFVLATQTSFGFSGGRQIQPKAGETLTVALGEGTRRAEGTLDLAKIPQPVDAQWLRARAFRTDPPLSPPVGLAKTEQWDAMLESLKSNEPTEDSPLSLLAHVGKVEENGNLRFVDLEPGKYVIYISVHAAPEPNICGWGKVLATSRAEFEVPNEPGSTATLPLAQFPLDVKSYPQPGQSAPDFEVRGFDGQPVTLKQYRGKIVVLDFWASWCAPCQEDTPALRPIYDQFGKDGKVAFLGMDFDWKPGAGQGFVEQNKLAWPQAAMGQLSFENSVCRAYGVSGIPSIWVIDADGKVIARDLRAAQLKAVLEKALSSK